VIDTSWGQAANQGTLYVSSINGATGEVDTPLGAAFYSNGDQEYVGVVGKAVANGQSTWAVGLVDTNVFVPGSTTQYGSELWWSSIAAGLPSGQSSLIPGAGSLQATV